MPDSNNPLDGGILVEEPYSTEAYNLPNLPVQKRFVDMTYRASLPNLQPVDENIDNILAHEFNTQKVAAKGTLQRMKTKARPDIQSNLGVDTSSSEDTDFDQTDTERLLSTLTESFDMKMRLLLDPHYQSSGNISGANQKAAQLFPDSFNLDDVNLSGAEKKKIDEAKNVLHQVKAGRKVDLKRGGRVDKNVERKVRGSEGSSSSSVLRQVNTKRQLDRSNSLTKQEKTEMNLRAQEKENSVSFLKDQFEKLCQDENMLPSQRPKVDLTKLRKKISECKNRRIQRRHTVGGTKDFSDSVVDLLVRGVSAWDRLAPIPMSHHDDDPEEDRRLSLQFDEERTLSLPTVESNV